jgi:hypothetical protein
MDKAEDILRRLFGRYADQDQEGLIGFFAQWQKLVGTDLAAHAEPVDIKNGALYLEVDHPAWLQRLHTKQADILKAVQERFPNLQIHQIYFRKAEDKPAGTAVAGAPPAGAPAAKARRSSNAPEDGESRREAGSRGENKSPGEEQQPQEARPPVDSSEALKRLPESKLKESLARLREHLDET